MISCKECISAQQYCYHQKQALDGCSKLKEEKEELPTKFDNLLSKETNNKKSDSHSMISRGSSDNLAFPWKVSMKY